MNESGMEVRQVRLAELDSRTPIHCAGAIMVMPFTDVVQAMRAARLAGTRAGAPALLLAVHDEVRQGFIATVNQAFAATRSPWFGYMAQDAFAGRAWLALALRAMQARGAGLLGFNDGKWQGQLAAFGLAERAWSESVYSGDFFHSAYRSHYADTELTVIAREQGRYVYEPNSVLVEADWEKDSAGVNPADRALYKARAAAGFDARVRNPQLLQLFG
ncbi:MAG: hypothetical protein QE283_09265 [Rhodoferax sp.]|nr:hypothetical protein [Rhodoferax sp.]